MDCYTTWQSLIEHESEQDYFQEMMKLINLDRDNGKVIYPPECDIYTAFELTPMDNVKVVILGQDPYHGANQAHGLSFSVLPGIKIPPSLRNMYKELCTDIKDFIVPNHGNLQSWAEQGVLLLNTVLTVEEGSAHSHAKYGWETFTDRVVKVLNDDNKNLVFILWGAHAQKKGKAIDRNKHLVLESAHPSPLSARRGFFGSQHFSKTNRYLTELKKAPIDWQN